MLSNRVTFVELPVFSGVVPLASGYMEAYCRTDPVLAASFEFEKISLVVNTPYDEVLATLQQSDAGVYAFSCYVWNSGLVRRLVDALLISRPHSHFVLGGPQVMHQGMRYLVPEHENVLICNGEGEKTFANFLRMLLSGQPDFSGVRSLSFYRNGKLVTTEAEPRINDLSEIPSPFLEGLFESNKYSWMLIETNRGCPFKCNYCYWGAATGMKVYKYDEERLKRELAWISQSRCWYLFIADANWGMLKRDVELSEFIVECHKRDGAPHAVYFCESKNTPDRVAEITRIFHGAGMISTQSVALQTMNPETLIRVNRDNIKTSAYTDIQQSLNQQGIASFVEMIWPLPGETLSSFQEGLGRLCEIGADSFFVYPLLLMNNVELCNKREEYGLVTVPDPDPNSEAEIVVQTNEVNTEDYRAGQLYVYAVLSLHVLRGLSHLGRYLNSYGLMSYVELFRAFTKFCRQNPGHSFATFCEESVQALENANFSNTGALVHLILHSEREAFDEFLEQFVTTQAFWHDPMAQFLFEVDIINRPYIYRNTPIVAKRRKFMHLRVLETFPKGYLVELPSEYLGSLREQILPLPVTQSTSYCEVNHRRSQLPFMLAKSLREHFMYCQDMSQRMMSFLPIWREKAPAAATAAS